MFKQMTFEKKLIRSFIFIGGLENIDKRKEKMP